ncbi:MAG: YlxR family protein [Clostridia bacterium]|nr:YlxR family protein [Clostridia bacterium]
MKQRKIPMRRCNGCNEQKPKNELIRVVKSPENEISLDLTGKKSGRGAYICNDIECLRKARKSRRIDRTFEMAIPDEVYNSLEEQIKKDD